MLGRSNVSALRNKANSHKKKVDSMINELNTEITKIEGVETEIENGINALQAEIEVLQGARADLIGTRRVWENLVKTLTS